MRWLKQTLFPAAVNNTHRELLPRHWWQEDVNSIYQVNGKHYAAKSERSRFSRASLTGIFSHTALGRPCWGRAARALGSAGGAAQPSRRHRAREDVQWQPWSGSSGSAPREHLQQGAGSERVRQEPACGCLHPSTQMDPKIRKILTSYFELHSPGLYTVGGVMGTVSVFLDNLMSCCNEGSTEPLICMQFPHEM